VEVHSALGWQEAADKVDALLATATPGYQYLDELRDIYFMLKNGSSDETIANRLGAIETERMGLARLRTCSA
jgi:hypothetical protein